MSLSSQEQQPPTTAYVPRHLAAPDASERVAGLPADPRGLRWDRSMGALTRVLDELSVLDDGSVPVGSH
ncbi:hypothetical protein [Oerskovia turbata]